MCQHPSIFLALFPLICSVLFTHTFHLAEVLSQMPFLTQPRTENILGHIYTHTLLRQFGKSNPPNLNVFGQWGKLVENMQTFQIIVGCHVNLLFAFSVFTWYFFKVRSNMKLYLYMFTYIQLSTFIACLNISIKQINEPRCNLSALSK